MDSLEFSERCLAADMSGFDIEELMHAMVEGEAPNSFKAKVAYAFMADIEEIRKAMVEDALL